MDEPFRPVIEAWIRKLRAAHEYKQQKFQRDADEAMAFFNGPYDFLYGIKFQKAGAAFTYQGKEQIPTPRWAMTVNKVSEGVQLFGPALYHRNPVRQVTPRQYPALPPELVQLAMQQGADPAQIEALLRQDQTARVLDAARAELLQSYLNWTPTALGLKDESRRMIDEAIIKGMGVLFHELYVPPSGGPAIAGSFYDTVDNLLIDPDMESIKDAMWIARRCCHPVWEVEDEYGWPRGSLMPNIGFSDSGSPMTRGGPSKDDWKRRQGVTSDMLVYWKVYSKLGMGEHLAGSKFPDELKQLLSSWGKYCYLVIAEGIKWPLNLPPSAAGQMSPESGQQVFAWPTPFWMEGGWPFSYLAFHEVPRCCWPMGHFKPGMGELQFINWCYSFVAGKIQTSCRDLLVVAKMAGEEIKRVLLSGGDYELIEIEKNLGPISDLVQFLQHPTMNGDIWKVVEAVERNFEKRVGLTELMYGESASVYRSAQEAAVKSDLVSIRPDDMAQKTEEAMTTVARAEALLARVHLTGADIEHALGTQARVVWDQLVVPTDLLDVLHAFEYRIEAGSARKPNKARDVANMKDAMATLMPLFSQLAMATGQVGPINSLIAAWAKSMDMDAANFMLAAPPPPPPPPEESGPALDEGTTPDEGAA